MKKVILITGLGLLTLGVTGAVLSTNKKSEKETKKESVYKNDGTTKKSCAAKKKRSCIF